jgi:integrase
MKYDFYFRLSQGGKKRERGFGLIHFYFISNKRKVIEKSTGISAQKDQWDEIAKKFIGEGAGYKNAELNRVRSKLDMARANFLLTGSTVLLEESISPPKHKMDLRARLLLEVVDEYIELQKHKIRQEGQKKHSGNIEIGTYVNHLKRRDCLLIPYLKLYNLMDILIKDVNIRFFETFDIWITSQRTPQGKTRGQAYANKGIKFLKTVLKFALGRDYIHKNIGTSYDTKKESAKPVKTLSLDDIEKMEKVEFLTIYERKCLDAFLFSFETFLHHGDYMMLKPEHIKTDKNGGQWLVKDRKKSTEDGRQVQRIPLTEKAIALIDKYGGVENLPKIHNGRANFLIKNVAIRAGIDKHVCIKMARSAAISNSYNNKKMRGESISIMAGWSTTRELKAYLQVDLKQLKNEYLNPNIITADGFFNEI